MFVEFLVVTDSNTQVVSECGSRYSPVSLLESKLSDFTWPLANAERFLTINADNNQQSKKKNAKHNWNHEANPSVFTARNDIYASEFFMSAQCVTGWSRTSSTRLNRFRNTLYTGQWDASTLLRITNKQDMNRGSMNYHRACSSWINFVERLQFLKMSNHHSISD